MITRFRSIFVDTQDNGMLAEKIYKKLIEIGYTIHSKAKFGDEIPRFIMTHADGFITNTFTNNSPLLAGFEEVETRDLFSDIELNLIIKESEENYIDKVKSESVFDLMDKLKVDDVTAVDIVEYISKGHIRNIKIEI